MNNTKLKTLVIILILCIVTLAPVITATERVYPYGGPSYIVEAGGPYETISGGNISFYGYIQLNITRINLTGYTWDFGDGKKSTYNFTNPVSGPTIIGEIISGPTIINCNINHSYSEIGDYTATLTAHFEDNGGYTGYAQSPTNPGIILEPRDDTDANCDSALVIIIMQYPDWTEYHETSVCGSLSKKVLDAKEGWSETTSLTEGGTVVFKITFTAPRAFNRVTITDYLPSTVRFISATPTPDTASGPKIYFDYNNHTYRPYKKLVWNSYNVNAYDQIDIEIRGKVEYLNKSYFNLLNDSYLINYTTRNYAEANTKWLSDGCGNRNSKTYGDAANFTIGHYQPNPSIDIEKYVSVDGGATWDDADSATGPTAVVGSTVKFYVNVTNTGNVGLTNIVVTDTDFTFSGVATSLASGAYDVSDILITTAVAGQQWDEATVTGTPPAGSDVTDKDKAYYIGICPSNPDIDVEKSVKQNCNGPISYDGIYIEGDDPVDWVTFILEVKNTGNVPLDVVVVDTLPAGLIYNDNAVPSEPDSLGDNKYRWNLGIVGVDQTVTITFRAVVGDQVCGELINKVNVTGVYGQTYVYDEDEVYVFVLCPGINIVKEADPTVIHSGDIVTYTYTVTNTGNCQLKNVTVSDDKIPGVSYVSGDTNGDHWLDCNETWVYTASSVLHVDTINTGNVSAKDELGKQVFDEDYASVDVIHPDIKVVKKVTPNEICSGESVTWNIAVENTGDVTLTNVFVIDDNIGVLGSMITLASGGKRYYEYYTYPTANTVNIVLVNGTDPLGLEVKNGSSVSVTVTCEPCEPGISIEKKVWNGSGWAETTDAKIGDTVLFKGVIYNPSDCYMILFGGVVFDKLPYNLRYVNGSSTIYQDWPNLEYYDWVNNIVYWHEPPTIMPNENLTFYYNATVVDCGRGINNLTAHPDGFDPVDYPGGYVSNAGSYDVSDNASVNVECPPQIPDIKIVKTHDASCCVGIGETITYTYTVTNNGSVTLYNVTVVDDVLGSVSLNATILEPGDWAVGSAEHVVTENDLPGPIENSAIASGEDQFGTQVSDEDSRSVEICEPPEAGVSIEKLVELYCTEDWHGHVDVGFGKRVKFKLIVDNTGDTVLNLTLIDTLPDNLKYDGGADYTPSYIDDQVLTWVFNNIGPDDPPIVIVFAAKAVGCGFGVNWGNVTTDKQVHDEDNASVTVTCEPEHDNTPPSVEITKPKKKWLYRDDQEIRRLLFRTRIIGPITIEVNASDESGIQKVEFYINGKLKGNDTTAPYNWTWDQKTFFIGIRTIRVKAYDTAGNTNSDERSVWKMSDFNFIRNHPWITLGVISGLLLLNKLKGGKETTGPSEETENKAPEADAGGSYAGIEGTPVQFDGSKSNDPDNDTLKYEWNFGDGSIGTGEKPLHAYNTDGEFTVTLTVTDSAGASDTDTATVKIAKASSSEEGGAGSAEEGNLFWYIVSGLGLALLTAIGVLLIRRKLYV